MGGIEDNQPNSNRSEGIEGISSMPQKTPNEIRNESFLTWLKYMLCPNFKYSSFIWIITCKFCSSSNKFIVTNYYWITNRRLYRDKKNRNFIFIK